MCCVTTPEAVSGSIERTDPVVFLREQQVNGEYILLVTTALTREKTYLIFEVYKSKIFFFFAWQCMAKKWSEKKAWQTNISSVETSRPSLTLEYCILAASTTSCATSHSTSMGKDATQNFAVKTCSAVEVTLELCVLKEWKLFTVYKKIDSVILSVLFFWRLIPW